MDTGMNVEADATKIAEEAGARQAIRSDRRSGKGTTIGTAARGGTSATSTAPHRGLRATTTIEESATRTLGIGTIRGMIGGERREGRGKGVRGERSAIDAEYACFSQTLAEDIHVNECRSLTAILCQA